MESIRPANEVFRLRECLDMLRLPIRTDIPLRRTPWMNWALLAINVVVFAIGVCGGPSTQSSIRQSFGLDPRDPQLLNYFTYAFCHDGWLHLLSNLIALYVFGNHVNDRAGQLGYLALFLAGAVFAGVGCVATGSSALVIVGASGAVMAVTGAYLALFPRSSITIYYWLLFVGSIEVPGMYLILVFFLVDVIAKLAGDTPVAHTGHIFGMLFGFGVGMGLLAVGLLPRDPFDFLALAQRWNRRRHYQSLVRQGFNPFAAPPAPARSRPPAYDPLLQRIRELRAEINEAAAHHNLPHAAILFLELKSLDPEQVLARQAQLDVANQLASQRFFTQAADAYEQFLQHYPAFEQTEQVELMLGVIYARYLEQYERARVLLTHALKQLHAEREVGMAQTELTRIEMIASGKGEPRSN